MTELSALISGGSRHEGAVVDERTHHRTDVVSQWFNFSLRANNFEFEGIDFLTGNPL